jgi:phosphoglycolate phosphatase-like HAD superfamily hydrolase
MKLVLFDIDGTLMLSGGAGMRSFYRAMRQVFGIVVDSEVVRPDGKTDPLIAREMLAHFGQSHRWNEASREALFSCYLACLGDEMKRAREGGAIRVLPGVAELLEMLAAESEFALGLVTGNLEEGARIKLENARLAGYFRYGGYGSDSENRTELIRLAIERGARLIAPAPLDGAFVIGDTPLDITHGRAAGACVIAVASAKYSLEDLSPFEPDLLVRDLTAPDLILSFLRRWSRN